MHARRSIRGEDLRPSQDKTLPLRRTLADLRAATLAGSEIAAAHFLRDLRCSITRWLTRRLPYDAADDVDDYTQEALWRIWTRLRECHARDERGIRAWALTIAWRVAVADRRRRVRTIPLHDESALRRAGVDNAHIVRKSDASNVPIPALIDDTLDSDAASRSWGAVPSLAHDGSTAELLARIASNAQRRLPTSTQELIYARLIEHVSWCELGRRYGITAPAARRRYQRAQHSLRRYVVEDLSRVCEPRRSQAVIWLSAVCATSD